MSDLEKILNIQEFATLPEVTTKILDYIEQDNFNFSGLAKLIETDATLSMKLIKVANSPMFAMKVNINSINQVVQVLGANRVANLVLAVSIFSKFVISENKKIVEFINKVLWHSSCVAIVAKSISKKLNLSLNEKEFTFGILHDMGKLAMLQYDPRRYLKVLEMVQNEDISPIVADKKLFDCTHVEVTTAILNKWKMPPDFVGISTRRYDLCRSDYEKNLMSVVLLADVFCEIWGSGFFGGISQVQIDKVEYWEMLSKLNNLQDFDLEKFTIELEEEFKNTKNFLDIMQA